MTELVICRCARHVRDDEARCPFCGANALRGERSARAGRSRAALYGYAAALAATTACRSTETSTATVTIGPEPSATPTLDAAPPATATASTPTTATTAAPTTATAAPTVTAKATVKRHRTGATCAKDSDCAGGLACCPTGFTGKCGGARMPGGVYAPCVIIDTCVAPPCRQLAMPPYGGAFPAVVTV